jgi:Holliday junction resolvase RusA-like endonuclease
MNLFPEEVAESVRFFVEGEPVPQPRQRHAYRHGIITSYIPQEHPIHAFKQAVRLMCRAAYKGNPFTEPLIAHMLFLLPRPGRLLWKTKPMPRVWAPGRPDLDNYEKGVMDALNKFLWEDDSQVVELHARKLYAAGDESPGVHVMVQVAT